MNNTYRSLFATALSLLASLALPVHAQVISTVTNFTTGNFNTNLGWVAATYVTGQNASDPLAYRWQGNDPTVGDVGGTDYIAYAFNYTVPGAGNLSMLQGGLNAFDGYVPGTTDVQLWRAFAPAADGINSFLNSVTYFTEWSLFPSANIDPSYPNNDLFAFDLRTSDNSASLIKFALTPGINLQPDSYTLQWIRNAGTVGAVTNTLYDLGYQSLFQLQIDITGSTFNAQVNWIDSTNRSVITNFGVVTNGSLSGLYTAQDFGTVALDWELASTNSNDPGSNYIVVNNFIVTSEVSVIPESGTWAAGALLLGGVAAGIYRRRRRLAIATH